MEQRQSSPPAVPILNALSRRILGIVSRQCPTLRYQLEITSNKNRSNKRQERLIEQRMIEGTCETNRSIWSSDNTKKITPNKAKQKKQM